MAEANDIVNVSIRLDTVFPTEVGFGTPCITAYHTLWPQLAKRFTTLKTLTDAGVSVKSALYRAATKLLSNDPTVSAFIVGKRTSTFTQVLKITPKVSTVGYIYSFTFVETSGAAADLAVSYTVQMGDDLTAIAAAIAALIVGADVASSVAVTGVITLTMVANKHVLLNNLPPVSVLQLEDTTADPGIVADMTAINAAAQLDTSLSFFAWTFDRTGKAEIVALAAYVETLPQIALVETIDSAKVPDSGTSNDAASTLKTAAYSHTAIVFTQHGTGNFRAQHWVGEFLPFPVGSYTAAMKTLKGQPADSLSPGEASTVEGKNCSTYRPILGTNITFESKTPDGNFIDTIIGQLELQAALQIAVFGEEVTRAKIPFTDAGIRILANRVRATLADRTASGPDDLKFLASDPAPIVTPPLASAVSPSNKAARILDPPISFTAKIAGAIHRAKIAGTIGV
jgi:hypothetical protein